MRRTFCADGGLPAHARAEDATALPTMRCGWRQLLPPWAGGRHTTTPAIMTDIADRV